MIPVMLTKTNPVTFHPGLHIGPTTIHAYAYPDETLGDLLTDHDPMSAVSILMHHDDRTGYETPATALRYHLGADDLRDTRATLLCTLLAVDSWGL